MKNLKINPHLQELKQHGNHSFPYIVYRGRIPEYIHSYPLHWHEEMEIIITVSGIGTATINSVTYNVHAGDILVIRPHDIHSISQYKENEWEYFNILFRFSILEDKLNNKCFDCHFKPFIEHTKKLPVHITPKDPISKPLTMCIDDLITNRKKAVLDYELMIKANLFTIMYHLEQYASSDITSSNKPEYYDKLKAALSYIDENYNTLITIDDVAKHCYYSKSYFMKFFKKYTGSSFIQYLNNYRLEVALRLLTETDLKITDIATSIGFDNLPYFTRCFIKKYHMTPSAARKAKFYHNNK